MGYQKIKAFGWIVFEIIDRLAGSETYLDPNSYGIVLLNLNNPTHCYTDYLFGNFITA